MVYVYVKGKEITDAFRLTLGKKIPSLKSLGKHLFSKAKSIKIFYDQYYTIYRDVIK